MSIQPLELRFAVRGYDCGYGGPIRVLALADMLQEAAGDHAALLDLGRQAMAGSGRTWMLARTDTRIFRSPREGETVSVTTWPAATEKLFALRDFLMESERGEILAAASYAYLIVDLSSRRPLRPEGILPPGLAADRPRALPDARYSAQRSSSPYTLSFRERANYRHIDHNGHVNNAHLISWAVDAVPRAAERVPTLSRIRVEFAQEVLQGDEVEAWWAPLPAESGVGPSYATELRRGAEPCVRVETSWLR